jgi:N-acetylmuramoyl-L-alanine amidase
MSMKRFTLLFLVLVFTGSFHAALYASVKPYKLKTVVIDAGHGGHDPGCHGIKSKEKDIALDVALKLGKAIEDNYPDVKVVYTRKTDVFVELVERAEIANKAKADLFISIHCNANDNKAAYGSETYAMGLHVSEANLNVAKRENSVILLEENYEQNYDGFDPKSTEAYIIFSLYQSNNLDRSLSLASKVQDQFSNKLQRFNRGVKQAGFIVLYKTNMPSILIELGFLSNKDDEKYLVSESGQNEMSASIFHAFKTYKSEMEKEK